jgi:hypothetical protein
MKKTRNKKSILQVKDAADRKGSLRIRTGVRAGEVPAIQGNTGGGTGSGKTGTGG